MSGSLMNGEIKTIAEQIYMLIRSDILHHKLTGGERLTMKFLQERLGVSSSPIREALTRLQQDGLVEYQPNVGMRVTKFSAKDVNDIYAFPLPDEGIFYTEATDPAGPWSALHCVSPASGLNSAQCCMNCGNCRIVRPLRLRRETWKHGRT